MKKLMTLMLGMGLAIGSVSMFAQAPKADTATKAAKTKKSTVKKTEATKAAKTKKSTVKK